MGQRRFARVRERLACAALALAASCASCGYRAVYGGEGGERLHVALVRSLVPDAVATDEVVAGVRERLAREGALADGDGFPRVELEVLRADEIAEGVLAPPAPGPGGAAGPGTVPRARGLARGLVVRGWVRRAEGATPERDTGDLRALDLISVDSTAGGGGGGLDPMAAMISATDAARATGRRLGHRIALRILGFPVPSDEAAGLER